MKRRFFRRLLWRLCLAGVCLGAAGAAVAAPLPAAPVLHWCFPPRGGRVEMPVVGRGPGALLLAAGHGRPLPERVADGAGGAGSGALRLAGRSLVRSREPFPLPGNWTLSFWMKDQRPAGENGASFSPADLVSLRTRLIGLGEDWFFRLDPDERGLDEGWAHGADPGAWAPMPVPAFWGDTAVGPQLGFGWYRTVFFVPAGLADEEHELHFAGVDEQAWVYVNGHYAGERTTASTGRSVSRIWNEPFSVRVGPGHLRPGENRLVVRVHASGGAAGIFRPVTFRPPAARAGALDLAGLTASRRRPGHWEHVALKVAGGRAALYLDGVRAAGDIDPGAVPAPGERVELEFRAAAENGFTGLLDDVRFYATDLDDGRIAALAADVYRPGAAWVGAREPALQPLITAGALSPARADRLARLGAPDTAALLARALESDCCEQRHDALLALGLVGDGPAQAALVGLLAAPDAETSAAAAAALERLRARTLFPRRLVAEKGERASELLPAVLEHAPLASLRLAAVTALAESADPATWETLAAAFDRESWPVRREIARVMHAGGQQSPAPPAASAVHGRQLGLHREETAPFAPFHFAVLADPRVDWDRRDRAARLEGMLAGLAGAARRPEQLFLVGDIRWGPTRPADRLRALLDESGLPWHVAWGGLDFPRLGEYLAAFTPLYYSFTHRNCLFLVLWSGWPAGAGEIRLTAGGGDIDEGQFRWLENTLEHARDAGRHPGRPDPYEHIFIFLAHPPQLDADEPAEQALRPAPSRRLAALCRAHGVTAVFAAAPAPAVHEEAATRYVFLAGPDRAEKPGGGPGYLLVTVEREGINHEFMPLEKSPDD